MARYKNSKIQRSLMQGFAKACRPKRRAFPRMLKEVKGRDDQNAIISTFLGVSFCQGNNIYIYIYMYLHTHICTLFCFCSGRPFHSQMVTERSTWAPTPKRGKQAQTTGLEDKPRLSLHYRRQLITSSPTWPPSSPSSSWPSSCPSRGHHHGPPPSSSSPSWPSSP